MNKYIALIFGIIIGISISNASSPKDDGQHDDISHRRKRQASSLDIPTFGPDVERTADGVPIFERSYLDRTRNEPRRPAAAFFSRFEQPSTTESEGLRLYEGLLASSGGRNELRSLDNEGSPFGQNELQSNHRSSGSWSETKSRRKTSRRTSTIQLKSGDSHSALSSGISETANPNFSEEVTYRRSSSGLRSGDSSISSANGSGGRITRKCVTTTVNEDGSTTTTTATNNGNGNRRCATIGASSASTANSAATHSNSNSNFATRTRNTQTRRTSGLTRSLHSSSSNSNQGSNGFSCITANCGTGSSLSSDNPTTHVTYHRRSRVPSTGFLLPTAPSTQLRSLQFPPIQRFGRGDQEVSARVLHSDNENDDFSLNQNGHNSHSASESASQHHSSSQQSESSSGNQGATRQTAESAYKSGRKLNKKYYRRTVVKNFTSQAFPSEEIYSFTSS